jgi:hypothetical protein
VLRDFGPVVADLGGFAGALIGEAEAFGFFGNCYFGGFGHIDILLWSLYPTHMDTKQAGYDIWVLLSQALGFIETLPESHASKKAAEMVLAAQAEANKLVHPLTIQNIVPALHNSR